MFLLSFSIFCPNVQSPKSFVFCPLSFVLIPFQDRRQRTEDRGWKTEDKGQRRATSPHRQPLGPRGRPARCDTARASCSAAYHAAALPHPTKKRGRTRPRTPTRRTSGKRHSCRFCPPPRTPTTHNWKLATLETGNTCTLATFPSPLHAVAPDPTLILHHPPVAHAFSARKSHYPPHPRHPPHHRRHQERNPPRQHPVAQHDPYRKRRLDQPPRHHRQRARHQRMHQIHPQTRRT